MAAGAMRAANPKVGLSSLGPRHHVGGAVNTFKLIALVVLVAVAATLVQPGKAEAIDPLTAITIAGAAVLVVTVIAVVIIANVREGQDGMSAEVTVVAFDAGGVQGL
jgi:hypothetical protein